MPHPLGEFELIDLFTRGLPRAGEGVIVGIGDDAAVLAPPRGEVLVTTVDAVVEGVHFDARFTGADVGWKALAVNLSDLAAMGARPLWALVALGLPPGTTPRRVAAIARGLAACARAHRIAVVGGNVTRARDLSLTVTVTGSAPRRKVLGREGARPGDLVVVSGTVGDAALGLRPGVPGALLRRQRRPVPRLALGLAVRGIARAAIDVSDGLVQDLGHVCDASGVGAEVREVDVPRSSAYRAVTRGLADPLAPALAGGEDYELVLAVPPARWEALRAAARAAHTPVSVVGRFVPGRGVAVLRADGTHRPAPAGHDHLAPRAL